MATVTETVTRICDDLSRPESEISAVVEREILSAVQHYESRRFAFNERLLDVTLSATSVFAFSALVANDPTVEDIWEIDNMQVTYSSRGINVERIPWVRYFDLSQDIIATAAFPDFFSVYNKTVYVYPLLTTEITGEIAAHVKLLTLDAVTNPTNAWLTDGEELIRSRASRMVCQRKLDDFEKAAMFKALEDEAYRRLLSDRSVLHETGILSPNP